MLSNPIFSFPIFAPGYFFYIIFFYSVLSNKNIIILRNNTGTEILKDNKIKYLTYGNTKMENII